MAYEVDYSTCSSLGEKRERAIADMREWLAHLDFNALMTEISSLRPTAANAAGLRFQFEMFSGVSGYPVIALIGHCWAMTDDAVHAMLELYANNTETGDN